MGEKRQVEDGSLPEERYGEEAVSTEMMAIGALVLRSFTNELGAKGAIEVARRVFCAMRAVEARQRE